MLLDFSDVLQVGLCMVIVPSFDYSIVWLHCNFLCCIIIIYYCMGYVCLDQCVFLGACIPEVIDSTSH